MAHTYVIQNVAYPPNAVGDSLVTITGTVDGVAVTASCWFSVYISHAASAITAQNFIISLMLAAFNQFQTAVPQNAPPAGFTVTV